MGDSLYQLLGLVHRSHRLCKGETLWQKIRSRDVDLVCVAAAASDRTKKQYRDKCSFYGIDLIMVDGERLNQALGRQGLMAVGVMDRGFAARLQSLYKEEGGSAYETKPE